MKSFTWSPSQFHTNGKEIITSTFGRRDLKMVKVSCNPKKYRKCYAWCVITLGKCTLEHAELDGDVHFFVLDWEYPFWETLVQKFKAVCSK